MNSIFYVIAVILFIGWAVGLLFAVAGSLIHIFLLLALMSVAIGLIRRATAI